MFRLLMLSLFTLNAFANECRLEQPIQIPVKDYQEMAEFTEFETNPSIADFFEDAIGPDNSKLFISIPLTQEELGRVYARENKLSLVPTILGAGLSYQNEKGSRNTGFDKTIYVWHEFIRSTKSNPTGMTHLMELNPWFDGNTVSVPFNNYIKTEIKVDFDNRIYAVKLLYPTYVKKRKFSSKYSLEYKELCITKIDQSKLNLIKIR